VKGGDAYWKCVLSHSGAAAGAADRRCPEAKGGLARLFERMEIFRPLGNY